MLTVTDCSKLLSITPQAVRLLIKSGKLRATRFASLWSVTDEDLQAFIAVRRRPGRVKQSKPENM